MDIERNNMVDLYKYTKNMFNNIHSITKSFDYHDKSTGSIHKGYIEKDNMMDLYKSPKNIVMSFSLFTLWMVPVNLS